MSRRRGEFEHRTTIFEGAFRAWSHLGGLDPEDLESKSSSDLDPLTNPLMNDRRLTGKNLQNDPDGSTRREYPYEPLPRAGLAHPFIQVSCTILPLLCGCVEYVDVFFLSIAHVLSIGNVIYRPF
jgi:hypothetical protein